MNFYPQLVWQECNMEAHGIRKKFPLRFFAKPKFAGKLNVGPGGSSSRVSVSLIGPGLVPALYNVTVFFTGESFSAEKRRTPPLPRPVVESFSGLCTACERPCLVRRGVTRPRLPSTADELSFHVDLARTETRAASDDSKKIDDSTEGTIH